MNPATRFVLEQLRKKGAKGVTHKDFRPAFRLPARVYDLRKQGHDIPCLREFRSDGSWYGRYVLIQEVCE